MIRILVTGASGLFGANFILEHAERYRLVAVVHRHSLWGVSALPKPPEVVVLDLTDTRDVADVVGKIRPEVIVHAAAMTGVDACEEDPQQAEQLNVLATRHVAEAAEDCGAALIALSTDYVFDGRKGRYTEEDAPCPLGVYARTKLEGEQVALGECRRTTIVRTTLYGWNAQAKQSFAERVLEGLSGGPPVTAFTDMHWSPILANDLADAVARLIERPISGVFHVAGSERVSRYEFACAAARVFGLDPQGVRPGRLSEAHLTAPRPPDASLVVSKFEQAFGVQLPGVEAGLTRMRALRDTGVVSRLKRLLSPQ